MGKFVPILNTAIPPTGVEISTPSFPAHPNIQASVPTSYKTPTFKSANFGGPYSRSNENGNTSQKFLNALKVGNYDKVRSLFCHDFNSFDTELIDRRLEYAHELLGEYGVPPESKWEIVYDTNRELLTLTQIKIPVFIDESILKKGKFRQVYIELYYDYTKRYIGDYIFSFILDIQ